MGANHSEMLFSVQSKTLRHVRSVLLSNCPMRTIEEIRLLRLQGLMEEFGVTLAEINRRLERNARDSTLSRILNGAPDSTTGKRRAMGSNQARQLEQAFGKPVGWMDHDPAFDARLGTTASQEQGPPPAVGDPLRAALALIGMHIAAAPSDRRGALARNMAGWAEDGGPPHYLEPLRSLLADAGGDSRKQQRTGT